MSAEKPENKDLQAEKLVQDPQSTSHTSVGSEDGMATKIVPKAAFTSWAHPSQKSDDPWMNRPQRSIREKPVKESSGSSPVSDFGAIASSRRAAAVPKVSSVKVNSSNQDVRFPMRGNVQNNNASPKSDPKDKSGAELVRINTNDNTKIQVSAEERKVTVANADPVQKKPNTTVLGKRRHTKQKRKELKEQQQRRDGQTEGRSSGDMAVVHPDFPDESYLEVVDNGVRRESRLSSDYDNVITPLRFNSQKNKKFQSSPAFKARRSAARKKAVRGRNAGPASYDWEQSKRLPDDVVPFQYTVYIEPHIESNIFFGRVSIAFDLILPKSQIWLHAKNLHITSTQIFDQNDNQISVLGAHKFRKNEFFVVFFEGNLRPGIYMINIDYNSILSSRNSVGLITRDYKSRDGSNRHLVYTQLEPLYARRVFPCFDEPSFKATYDITVVRPSHEYIAVSNAAIETEVEDLPQRGYTTVHFSTTPLMSPCHFSLVICDFRFKAATDSKIDFPLNFYHKEEKPEAVLDAMKIVCDVVAWCQEYLQMPYPHPKLDFIIMPELTSVSTEALGVILIQDTLLKMKEDYEYETLHYTLSRTVISQWIGCSATVVWWSDLWYKEGLTMMLSNLFLDQNYPVVQAIPNFICYLLQPCLSNDIVLSTKRMDKIITDPVDISEYMDPIAFTKAAAVFRMLEQMDPEHFKSGVANFMSTYHLQNATWKNLGECLHKANERNPHYMLSIENVIYSWSQYPGHPLVLSARGQKAIAMTHRRLLTSNDCRSNNLAIFPTWEFPISYSLSLRPDLAHTLVMKADTIEAEIRNSLPENVQWYKVNVRQTGFYRVVYQENDWNNLKKVLLNKPTVFSAEDRANIIDDMFALSKAGFLCYGRTFMTLTYLRYGKETHWLPWACILKHLVFLKNAMSVDEVDLMNFKSYMSYVLDPILHDDVWNVSEQDEELTRRWKIAVLKVACTMEIPSAKTRLLYLQRKNNSDFKAWKLKPHLLRFLLLRYGASSNGYDDSSWLALWKIFQNEKNKLEKHKLLSAIASVANDTQRESLMKTIRIDDKNIDDQAFFTVLYEMSSTRSGALFVWNFMRNNWNYLTDRFASTDSRLFLLFPHVAQYFDEDKYILQLQEFSAYDIPTLESALSLGRNNIYWTNKYRKTVSSWLKNVQRALKPPGYSKQAKRNERELLSPPPSQKLGTHSNERLPLSASKL